MTDTKATLGLVCAICRSPVQHIGNRLYVHTALDGVDARGHLAQAVFDIPAGHQPMPCLDHKETHEPHAHVGTVMGWQFDAWCLGDPVDAEWEAQVRVERAQDASS